MRSHRVIKHGILGALIEFSNNRCVVRGANEGGLRKVRYIPHIAPRTNLSRLAVTGLMSEEFVHERIGRGVLGVKWVGSLIDFCSRLQGF